MDGMRWLLIAALMTGTAGQALAFDCGSESYYSHGSCKPCNGECEGARNSYPRPVAPDLFFTDKPTVTGPDKEPLIPRDESRPVIYFVCEVYLTEPSTMACYDEHGRCVYGDEKGCPNVH